MPKQSETKPHIAVIGVGGGGGNAVNNMIAAGLTGAHFLVANTDAQALAVSSAERRIQLGASLTEGLGAGAKPEIGEAAAEEALEEIRAHLSGSHMVFIAAGMGGGTGTGAASVIARVAKEFGILTVAVVTKPFLFEGSRRMRIADAGIAELKRHVDTLLVIPNQNLFNVTSERTTFAEAFVMADQVLYSGVACIVDLIVKDGLINLDLADVKTVLSGMGTAMMGTGEASGEQRAVVAAEEAIVNPLLDEVQLQGARSVLLSITGSRGDLTLWEVDKAANRVREEIDADAVFIFGATFDETLGDKVRVSIVASGMARSAQPGAESPVWTPRARRPAAGAANGADYRDRLSEAIGDFDPNDGAGPDRKGRGDARRAPGDVFIREAPPKLPGQPNGTRAGARAPKSVFDPDREYAPDEPVPGQHAAGRRGGRRPQAAEERDYWSKTDSDDASTRAPEPPAVYQRQPDSRQPKASLLRRLTGGGRGRKGDPRPNPPGNALVADEGDEPVDLPVFFGRDKK